MTKHIMHLLTNYFIFSSLPGTSGLASTSLPGATGDEFVFSPGGRTLSYSYGRHMGAQRTRGGALKSARGTGRKVTPVVKDESDPLHGVRKKMPYEDLVKELENNPDAEIRRFVLKKLYNDRPVY